MNEVSSSSSSSSSSTLKVHLERMSETRSQQVLGLAFCRLDLVYHFRLMMRKAVTVQLGGGSGDAVESLSSRSSIEWIDVNISRWQPGA